MAVWGSSNGLSIFCLDQSESACRSEDFPGNRWRYQADIVEALTERLYLQQAACEDAADSTGLHCTSGKQQSLCLLSSDGPKALCPPTSLADRAPALASLHSMLPSCSPSSDVGSALRLAALVASAAGAAHITAFIAGPCSIAAAGVSGHASALARHQVRIVSLASAAELGTDSASALQSLMDRLNSSSETCAHKVVFLDPPAERLEHWQQLEQVLELVDCKDSQHNCTPSPSPRHHQPPPQTPEENSHDASSAAVSSIEQPRQTASPVAGCVSTRGIQQQSSGSHRRTETQVWHKNRPLLAKRSGVFQSAMCRNESLDVLSHLSSDGCMRPWCASDLALLREALLRACARIKPTCRSVTFHAAVLQWPHWRLPSYATLHRAATESTVYPQHQLCPPSGPKWRVLLNVPAGVMRKVRSHAPAPGICSSAQPSAASKCPDEKLLKILEACMWDPGRLHAAKSKGHGEAVTTVQPTEFSLDGIPASHTQTGNCCASAPGSAPHAEYRRSRGGAQPRRHRPCTARHPLRLEADSRVGRLMLVETTDPRKLLRLIWCPPKPDASSSAAAPLRSVLQQSSMWERPWLSEDSLPPEGTLMKLPEHEVKMALDPAAVSFSAAHNGQVLVVEQAVAREGHLSQRPKYKGVFRNITAGEQTMDRCFFWLQEARASKPSTVGAKDKPLKKTVEQPGEAVTASEGTSANSVVAAEGSTQHEGRTQQHVSAGQNALVLHRLVQSAASRAHRNVHNSPAFPLLQISGSLQPMRIDSQLADSSHTFAAWGLQQESCPAVAGQGTQLSGSLKVTAGQQGRVPMDHTVAQCTVSSYYAALKLGHAQAHRALRDTSCGDQRSQRSTTDGFPGQVDLVGAASAEAGTEAGQDCLEDKAVYELD